jgi:hypothetical protein
MLQNENRLAKQALAQELGDIAAVEKVVGNIVATKQLQRAGCKRFWMVIQLGRGGHNKLLYLKLVHRVQFAL